MKKFLIVLILLILFILISNYSYLKSARVHELKSAWWCNLFPYYTLTNISDSINLNRHAPSISRNKTQSIQIKSKFMELFH